MSTIAFYNQMALILGVLSFILLLAAVFLWFLLDIKHLIAVLTGSEAKKGVGQIKRAATAGRVQDDLRRKGTGAVISWNTSGKLNNTAQMGKNNFSSASDPGATTLFNENSDETTLLTESFN
jgi:hypothetical protein